MYAPPSAHKMPNMNNINRIPVPANLARSTLESSALHTGASSFVLGQQNRSYKHQFSNLYFVRLRQLRVFVEENAARKWKDFDGEPFRNITLPCLTIAAERPKLKSRILDVHKGELCYIVGTVYLDMPLKPNILDDLGRDHSIIVSTPP